MSDRHWPPAIPALGRLSLALFLLAPASALFAGGCHEDVTLGTDPAPFCKGKPCGAPCAPDACDAPDCGVPASSGACDGDVTCTASVPACAFTEPCQGQRCGDPCTPLVPAAPPGTCDTQGTCRAGEVACPFDPCRGLSCGSLCNPECDPTTAMGGCPPPPVFMACDARGQCKDAFEVSCTSMLCAGMSCGDPCVLCLPMTPSCTETPIQKACDASGRCTPEHVFCP